jgi:hypothetical protein
MDFHSYATMRDWTRRVNAGSPGGRRDQSAGGWRTSPVVARTAKHLGLESAFRPRGRPKKEV